MALRTPQAFVQFFTYERHEPTISPQLLQDSADASVKSLPSVISAMQAAKPYSNFGMDLPMWGSQSAVKSIQDAPTNIINTQKAMVDLPVEKQKATTELQEQQLAQNRLKKLLNPEINPTTGKPMDISPYVTNISGPNVSVTPQQVQFGGTLPVQVTPKGTAQSGGQSSGQSTSQSGQSTSQPDASQPATPLVDLAGQYGGSTGVVDPFALPTAANPGTPPPASATPTPSSTPTSSATPALKSTSSASIPTSPVPVDSQMSMAGKPLPPAHVLDWYQHTQDTRGKEARAETGPDGLPTGRTIIMHNPNSGLADQAVHPDYLKANMGDWVPPTMTPPEQEPNAAMAAGAPPSTPADLLASGNLSPAQIIALGGPTTASTNNAGSATPVSNAAVAPQSKLPGAKAAPQVLPSAENLQRIQQQLYGQPQQTATPTVPLDTTGGRDGNHPAVTTGNDESEFFKKNFGGMTGQQFGQFFTDPKRVNLTGPAETSPDGGQPSTKATVNIAGQDYDGYIDQNGNPYLVRNVTPYHETRVYANGSTAEIDNTITKEEDEKMMKDSMDAGTVSGNWQSLPRSDKIAQYRQAQALKNYPVNEEATKRALALENVLDTGNTFLNQLQSHATQTDPTALNIRNVAHQGWSNGMNVVGPAIKDITKGAVNPGTGDPNSNYMTNAYEQWMNANRAEHATRPLPPGATVASADEAALGRYTDPELPTEVRNAKTKTAVDLNKQMEVMVANHNRISPNTMYKANLVINGENSPAANPMNAIQNVTSHDLYDKVPMYGWYKTPGYPTVQKLPKTNSSNQPR